MNVFDFLLYYKGCFVLVDKKEVGKIEDAKKHEDQIVVRIQTKTGTLHINLDEHSLSFLLPECQIYNTKRTVCILQKNFNNSARRCLSSDKYSIELFLPKKNSIFQYVSLEDMNIEQIERIFCNKKKEEKEVKEIIYEIENPEILARKLPGKYFWISKGVKQSLPLCWWKTENIGEFIDEKTLKIYERFWKPDFKSYFSMNGIKII